MSPWYSMDDEALLAECDVDLYCSSGKGGQNVNRRSTAVRLHHRPTGLLVTCQDERSQYRNKILALEELRHRIDRLNFRQRRRVPTAMSRGVRQKILTAKRVQSQKKVQRRKPVGEE